MVRAHSEFNAMIGGPDNGTAALLSPDGESWSARSRQALAAGGRVVKVVIGDLTAEQPIALRGEVESDLLRWREEITHLHLWSLDIDALPCEFPALRCLDMRGCQNLRWLAGLPTSLEVLDLGGCRGLERLQVDALPVLQRLYLDECKRLSPGMINELIRAVAQSQRAACSGRDDPVSVLRELSLYGCKEVVDLRDLAELQPKPGEDVGAPRLRKLVLRGCSKLTELPDLSRFELLGHLDLNGCAALEVLPELPIAPEPPADGSGGGLDYLVVHECGKLRSHRGLDLSEVLRSAHEDDNIAETARTLRWLGDDAAEVRSAKLVILGSGRVGKTTMAKALNWATLPGAEREAQRGKTDADPVAGSRSTHGIHFWQLETDENFRLDAEQVNGTVHVWDFGGQEIYHNTHRIFAESGTVFVIVCTDPETHATRTGRERPGHAVRGARYDEQNVYRELRYWLDYIRSAAGVDRAGLLELPIVLVHSLGDASAGREYLYEQAGERYQELMDRVPKYTLDCTNHNFVEQPNSPAARQFRRLCEALAGKLSQASERMGVRVPRFFSDVNAVVETRLATFNDLEARRADQALEFSDWRALIRNDLGLEPTCVEDHPIASRAVTRYLHRAGRLFWLGDHFDGQVLLDQRFALDAVYSLLSDRILESAPANRGWIEVADLKAILRQNHWSDSLDEVILGLLTRCDLCVVIGDHAQLLHPELLGDLKDARDELRDQWREVASQNRGHVNHSFRLTGQSVIPGPADYHAIAAWLARAIRSGAYPKLFGSNTRWGDWKERNGVVFDFFSSGLQARFWRPSVEEGRSSPEDEIVLRIEYSKRQGAPYEVALYFQILTSDEETSAEAFKSALFSDRGPLYALRNGVEMDDTRPLDVGTARWMLRGDPGPPWQEQRPNFDPRSLDVAISYRSNDRAFAEQIEARLKNEGISCYRYHADRDSNPRGPDHDSRITEIYDWLEQAKCLIILGSKDYFDLQMNKGKGPNVYCAAEFAMAVATFAEKNKRPVHFTLLSDGFTMEQFDAAARKFSVEFNEYLDKLRMDKEGRSGLEAYALTPAEIARRNIEGYLGNLGLNDANRHLCWNKKNGDKISGETLDRLIEQIRRRL